MQIDATQRREKGMDLNYLFYRQQVERSKALTAASEAARRTHDELARKYEEQIELLMRDLKRMGVENKVYGLRGDYTGMGTMPMMNDPTTFTTTGTPGVYKGKANIEMAGEWQAQVSYEGAAGKGKTSFPVMVQ